MLQRHSLTAAVLLAKRKLTMSTISLVKRLLSNAVPWGRVPATLAELLDGVEAPLWVVF